jgi:hypothetical protein
MIKTITCECGCARWLIRWDDDTGAITAVCLECRQPREMAIITGLVARRVKQLFTMHSDPQPPGSKLA